MSVQVIATTASPFQNSGGYHKFEGGKISIEQARLAGPTKDSFRVTGGIIYYGGAGSSIEVNAKAPGEALKLRYDSANEGGEKVSEEAWLSITGPRGDVRKIRMICRNSLH